MNPFRSSQSTLRAAALRDTGSDRGAHLLYTLALLWLAGAALRITVLAIPPVLPQLQRDLDLSQTPDAWVVTWSAVIGFCCAAIITLCLTLPPLLSKPDEVQRLAGAAFTIGYAWAVVIPVLGGFGWDLSTRPAAAFVPAAACGAIVAIVGARFHFLGDTEAHPA